MAHEQKAITIPTNIVSPTDIARLAREIESLDNFFREQAIRAGGAPTSMPRVSKLMDQLAADNQLNLLNETDRGELGSLLSGLHKQAPVMHISFSVDPPGPYIQKIVDWLRRNIDPHVLVTVGLQPNIGAGCVVRTTNKLFDFSLREFFYNQRDFFIEKLHQALTGEDELVPVLATPGTPPPLQMPRPESQQAQQMSPPQPIVSTTQAMPVITAPIESNPTAPQAPVQAPTPIVISDGGAPS